MYFDFELYDRIRSRLRALREYIQEHQDEAEAHSGLPLSELSARLEQVISGFELGVQTELTLRHSPALHPRGAVWAGLLVSGPTDEDVIN